MTSAEGDFEVKLKKKQRPEQLAMCILFRDWLIVSVQLDYNGSNWNTLCQNCGNYKKVACFSSHNSAAGSPGRSQNPDTVHLPITFISNYTSLASLTEITHSPLTLWWQKLTVVCRPSLVTSLEERGEENSHWAYWQCFQQTICGILRTWYILSSVRGGELGLNTTKKIRKLS